MQLTKNIIKSYHQLKSQFLKKKLEGGLFEVENDCINRMLGLVLSNFGGFGGKNWGMLFYYLIFYRVYVDCNMR